MAASGPDVGVVVVEGVCPSSWAIVNRACGVVTGHRVVKPPADGQSVVAEPVHLTLVFGDRSGRDPLPESRPRPLPDEDQPERAQRSPSLITK